jgi:hypothetical protein
MWDGLDEDDENMEEDDDDDDLEFGNTGGGSRKSVFADADEFAGRLFI